MKLIAMLLLSVVLILTGCESDSKSSNDLTPVLDASGQQVTNAAGEPLFTDEEGNTGTEAELSRDDSIEQPKEGDKKTINKYDDAGNLIGQETWHYFDGEWHLADSWGKGDTSDDSYGTDTGDSGNTNTGGDDSAGGTSDPADLVF